MEKWNGLAKDARLVKPKISRKVKMLFGLQRLGRNVGLVWPIMRLNAKIWFGFASLDRKEGLVWFGQGSVERKVCFGLTKNMSKDKQLT